MTFDIFLFYLFSILALLSAFCTVTSKNPIHSVLFLVGTFVSAGCLLVLFGAEYLGITFIIVYVGAIAIVFLFVIMIINTIAIFHQFIFLYNGIFVDGDLFRGIFADAHIQAIFSYSAALFIMSTPSILKKFYLFLYDCAQEYLQQYQMKNLKISYLLQRLTKLHYLL